MHCGEPRSLKATAARAAAAVVATPHLGRCRQRPCSTVFHGWLSQSSYPKRPSISPKDLQRSILPTVSYVARGTTDDVAFTRPDAAGQQPHMPEEWPDFSEMKVDPDIEDRFFNRSREYGMVMQHLNRKPTVPLVLLGPKNSGKSVSYANVS